MSQPEQARVRFALTKRQAEEIEDSLLIDSSAFMAAGVEQPDGSMQFDVPIDQLEDLADNVAAASNHADDPKLGARLDTIYRKLIKVLGRRS